VYAPDRQLRELVDEMGFHTEDPAHAFNPGVQIQPCSIDLRISDVFWRPSRPRRFASRVRRRGYAIDLRHSEAHALDPLRDWKRYRLGEGDTLTVKTGQVLMARVHERFRIPAGYAGKIEGRSSFARLGLAVHCTGDFINPGWEGFMPLQLVNCGPYPIRITPYVPLCQLMLVRLIEEPERTYGDPELKSKYENDEGGPSKWWRDHSIRELQKRLGEVHATERMQREIVDRVRFVDAGVLERFERYVAAQRIGDVENAYDLLDGFGAKEDRRRLLDEVAIASVGLFVAADLASLFVPFGFEHVVLIVFTVISVLVGFGSYVRRSGGYLGKEEIRGSGFVRDTRDDEDRAD
jgi:deoxycytidine triphosphate deaminase